MSTYQFMDHARWMERTNAAINSRNTQGTRRKRPLLPEKLTEFQAKVIDIVGMVGGGIYNAPICSPEKIHWTYGGRGVSLTWKRELSTWDFNQLTMLVFLCHEARIRCTLEAIAPCNLRMTFYPRKESGDMAVRHPSIEEAVESFRKYLPADHRIVFKPNQSEESENGRTSDPPSTEASSAGRTGQDGTPA